MNNLEQLLCDQNNLHFLEFAPPFKADMVGIFFIEKVDSKLTASSVSKRTILDAVNSKVNTPMYISLLYEYQDLYKTPVIATKRKAEEGGKSEIIMPEPKKEPKKAQALTFKPFKPFQPYPIARGWGGAWEPRNQLQMFNDWDEIAKTFNKCNSAKWGAICV